MIIVTGGAGFIGSNFILNHFTKQNEHILNIDKLTYASNLQNLSCLKNDMRYHFIQTDINDYSIITKLFKQYQPRVLIHFAAESHVDRSIKNPDEFIHTNINGTFTLLKAAKYYWSNLISKKKSAFRFVYISTDEVYGTLSIQDLPSTETTPYAPNNPYSASKAAANHLVRAYHYTYGLPTIITICCNNYGPFHFPEKLIPLTISNALHGKPLLIYGDGQQIRDWLYVSDHCTAIHKILMYAKAGAVYNIGIYNQKTNLEVIYTLCDTLDSLKPKTKGSYRNQITFVEDRPGHDRRYAIDASKLQNQLNWYPTEKFETGIIKTVRWYLNHPKWLMRS